MKISSEWINSYLEKPLSAQKIADALERSGVEVDGVVKAIAYDPKIVVGKVLTCERHSNADKLNIVTIDVKRTTLSIVCGAPNIATGQTVAVSQVGAKLPDGTVIGAAKLRGIESQGMVCSEQELGLSANHDGIMVLDDRLAAGTPFAKVVASDDVIDATTAANRWDLTSVIGLAREVAAHTDQKLQTSFTEHKIGSGDVVVQVQDPTVVPRYTLTRLRVDRTKATPAWMAARLRACGMRSINAVVDITNYILQEYGQPLHAFDASKVSGTVTVRRAYEKEILTTLDGVERTLSTDDIVIADDEKVIGLAGVKGGANSEIDDSTTEILLEAAVFERTAIRKTAVRHGLRTDASARYERGIPVEATAFALGASGQKAGAIGLFEQVCDATITAETVDIHEVLPSARTLTVRYERIAQLLGITIKPAEVANYIQRLGLPILKQSDSNLTIEIPWWRADISNEADIAEEVIILHGYEKLPATLPAWKTKEIRFDSVWAPLWRAKSALRSVGLFEIVTYSFISKSQITDSGQDPAKLLKLENPLSSEQEYLRNNLLPSLLQVAERNRTYGEQFGLFEFSKVYHARAEGELPDEQTNLAVLQVTPANGYHWAKGALDRLAREFNVELTVEAEVFDATLAHPTQSGLVKIGARTVGRIARLHPTLIKRHKIRGEVGYFEINWHDFLASSQTKTAAKLSKFPSITRDLSLLVDRGVSWSDISSVLSEFQIEFISDYYGGDLSESKKSITLRIIVQFSDRSPAEADAERAQTAVMEKLTAAFPVELR